MGENKKQIKCDISNGHTTFAFKWELYAFSIELNGQRGPLWRCALGVTQRVICRMLPRRLLPPIGRRLHYKRKQDPVIRTGTLDKARKNGCVVWSTAYLFFHCKHDHNANHECIQIIKPQRKWAFDILTSTSVGDANTRNEKCSKKIYTRVTVATVNKTKMRKISLVLSCLFQQAQC